MTEVDTRCAGGAKRTEKLEMMIDDEEVDCSLFEEQID